MGNNIKKTALQESRDALKRVEDLKLSKADVERMIMEKTKQMEPNLCLTMEELEATISALELARSTSGIVMCVDDIYRNISLNKMVQALKQLL